MKSASVDVVITGELGAALDAAVEAARHGQRVLVVLRTGNVRTRARLRALCRAATADATRVAVMTYAEVVCVDGVRGVEAVVIRHTRTGRLCAVNTATFVHKP